MAQAELKVRLVPQLAERDIPTLAHYVRTCANEMGLRDWEFEIMHGPPEDEDAYAVISVHEGRRYAKLWFCSDFRRLTVEEQRHAVAHELVHPHLCEMRFVLLALKADLGELRFSPVDSNFHRAEEKAVDALATVIERALPLIEWD